MSTQAEGLAAAVRGFVQDPHKATYEACVNALDQWDIEERRKATERAEQAAREASKPQPAVSAALRAEHAPELAGALRVFLGHHGNRGYASAVLQRYDNAVKAEQEAEAQRNKPLTGAYLAATSPAKGCNCETCREERRRGLRLDDSNF